MSDVIIYQGAAIPFSFSRQNGQPLDVTSVMRTLADITTYAANTEKKYVPYEGQTIACLEDKMLYILEQKNGVLVPKLSGGVKLIKKDDNVELTDDAALSALRSVKEIEDRAISRTKRDTAAEVIEFAKGLTAAGGKTTVSGDGKITTLNLLVQALAEIYDLNVSHVATMMRTIIKDYVSSEAFTPGLTGEGFKISKALNGDWNLEIDNIVVRKVMTTFEMIISKVRSVNGGLVISPANGRIKSVAETTGSPVYYVIGIEGDMQFVVDDFVRCQVFNGGQAKYYWVRVSSISGNSILVLKSEFTNGAVPAVGDDLVQMGNATNKARQGLIYLTASEDGKPRISVMDGVNSTSLVGKNKAILGCLDGITDTDFPADFQPSGYGLYAMNVFLKGIFVLRNGKSVEGEIEAAQNAASVAQAKADTVTRLFQEFTVAGGLFESKITETKTYADAKAKEAKDAANAYADGKVDGLQIGGRNLLLNKYIIGRNVSLINNGVEISFSNQIDTYFNVARAEIASKYEGETVTLSFQVSGLLESDDVSFYFLENQSLNLKLKNGLNSIIIKSYPHDPNSWLFDDRRRISTQKIQITYVKLELGNKPTDWTPAPEDVTADAQAKADAAQAAAEAVAIAKAELAKTEASAYADGIVTAEEQRAIADAQAKLAEAKLDAQNKADAAKQAAINDAAGKYPTKTEVSTSITQLSNSISLKVSQNDFNALGQRVGSAESAILQQADQIRLKASKSDLNTLSGRVTSTEAELRVHATEIGLKVTAGDVSAGMTITANKITLFGKEFDLTGKITFSSMASDAQGKINDAQNAANAAGAAAGTAQNTANKAITDAANAQLSATSANAAITNLTNSLGGLAYSDLVGLAKLDTTIIEGGYIKTNLINATAIVTSVLAATNVTATNLTVTGNSKVGGWTASNNSLTCNDTDSASLRIEIDGYRFLRINGEIDTFMSIRNDNSNCLRLSTTGSKAIGLSISAQNEGMAIKSAGGHQFMQRPSEVWNAPGVLWCGQYSCSNWNPALVRSWGDGLGLDASGRRMIPTISRSKSGCYTITHNLGHVDYFVHAIGNAQIRDSWNWYNTTVGFFNHSANSFALQFKDDGGGEKDPAEFQVMIFGRNKF